jgi:hypothetical protein
MKITELHSPRNGGTLYSGIAQSTRGRRYSFLAKPGERLRSAYREDLNSVQGRKSFWWIVASPAALTAEVRRAVRKAVRS